MIDSELVVARYEEPLTWLATVPMGWQLTVYNKGATEPAIPRAGSVLSLPNIGREGHTFLTHVIDRYDSLAEVTIFAQGNPFDHIEIHDLLSFFLGTTTAPIGQWLLCDSLGAPHHPGLPMGPVAECIDLSVNYPLGFVAGAMFRVKKSDILARSKAFYENARAILLQHELFGYCLERLWPAIWGYVRAEPVDEVYGLFYTHHRVPDKVLAASLASIQAMGIPDERLVISCHQPDKRLPDSAKLVYHKPADPMWIPSILEQMLAGLVLIPPTAKVLTLEHDVLYPATYLDQMVEAIQRQDLAYYYTLVRHIDLTLTGRPLFWASDINGTRTLQSCCGGYQATLARFAQTDLDNWRGGTYTKSFELGIDNHFDLVHGKQPVLDIRQGVNMTGTGFENEGYFFETENAYWGNVNQLRKRLTT